MVRDDGDLAKIVKKRITDHDFPPHYMWAENNNPTNPNERKDLSQNSLQGSEKFQDSLSRKGEILRRQDSITLQVEFSEVTQYISTTERRMTFRQSKGRTMNSSTRIPHM